MAPFDIETYLQKISEELRRTFGQKLLYIGLQGSFGRGEATDQSDIDIVVILEELTLDAMEQYRQILHRVGNWERSCGFICGRREMQHWNRFEICQLVQETTDYVGRLTDFVPDYTKQDVQDYIRMGVGNLYHELCHRYLHGSREELEQALPFLYKASFYLLQNRYWLRTGAYILNRQELLEQLTGLDREVLWTGMQLRQGKKLDTENIYQTLFDWCQQLLREEDSYSMIEDKSNRGGQNER